MYIQHITKLVTTMGWSKYIS